MSFWLKLKNLNNKTEEEKKRLVFVFTSLITGLIFIFWAVALVKLNLEPVGSNLSGSVGKIEQKTPIENLDNFFGEVIDKTSLGFNTISEKFKQFGDAVLKGELDDFEGLNEADLPKFNFDDQNQNITEVKIDEETGIYFESI